MKYAIIKVINGHHFIHSEGITDIASAKVQFHGLCQTLWNATDVITAYVMIADEQLDDVITAYVMIADEQLDAVEGYKEFIHHEPAPEPEEVSEE